MKKIFLGIDHPAVAAEDVEKMVKWYCDVLDYEIFNRSAQSAYLLKAPDGTYLEVMPYDGTSRPKRSVCTPGWSHLALRVNDMDQAMAELEARGVVWDAPEGTALGGGRLRNFSDPEGNMVQIIQR